MRKEYNIDSDEWELIFDAPLTNDYNDVVYGLVGTNRSTSPRFDSEKGLYVQATSNGQYAAQYTMNIDMAAKLQPTNGIRTTLFVCEYYRQSGTPNMFTIAPSYTGQGVPASGGEHYGTVAVYRSSADYVTNAWVDYVYVKNYNATAHTQNAQYILMDGSSVTKNETGVTYTISSDNLIRIMPVFYGNTYTGWLKNVRLYRLKAEL